MNDFDGFKTEEGSSASDQDSDDMPLAREALARRAPKKVCCCLLPIGLWRGRVLVVQAGS